MAMVGTTESLRDRTQISTASRFSQHSIVSISIACHALVSPRFVTGTPDAHSKHCSNSIRLRGAAPSSTQAGVCYPSSATSESNNSIYLPSGPLSPLFLAFVATLSLLLPRRREHKAGRMRSGRFHRSSQHSGEVDCQVVRKLCVL